MRVEFKYYNYHDVFNYLGFRDYVFVGNLGVNINESSASYYLLHTKKERCLHQFSDYINGYLVFVVGLRSVICKTYVVFKVIIH